MKSASTVKEVADRVLAERRIPCATYRFQFGGGFTFGEALATIPYLRDLGITDCYLSPILMARSDSSHGYDVSDHSRINPSFGGEEGFEALAKTVRKRGMGLILDVVPNHMGIGETSNTWWMDVLENGPSSRYASYFDIDWHPATRDLEGKVLLAILEDQFGKVLESGKLKLTYEEGAFFIDYYKTRLPIAPRTCGDILSHRLDAVVGALGEESEQVQELRSILTALTHLPPPTELDSDKIEELNRENAVVKRRIAALYNAVPEVRSAIDDAVRAFNGVVGDPRSFDLLDSLLAQQSYRLSYWRVAAEEINYRRFFDINDLAAIRVELPEVFQATHQLILRLLAEGKATGLRIDHPDGLWNPRQYFHQLQESYLARRIEAAIGNERSPDSCLELAREWLTHRVERRRSSVAPWPLYVVCEKILGENEPLPDDWAVFGTTGYDFLNAVNGLFVDGSKRKALERTYRSFVGSSAKYPDLVNSTKKMTMLVSMASEINALGHRLDRIAEGNRLYRDFTLNSLTFAIREVIACLPVYRTYVIGPWEPVTERDESYIEAAVAEAKKRNPRTASSIFDFIRDTLLLRNYEEFPEDDRGKLIEFVMKFQQLTGPVMAKGVEDTAFYVYNCLLSLNEVGGSPEQFGISVKDFHRRNLERQRRWPHSMLATSTHDTKRGEDVRARINVLSEMPSLWRAALTRWSRMNASKKTLVDRQPAPDRNDEYFLYQTLVGAWPTGATATAEFDDFRDRVVGYMAKATKEAKVHTSWINPNDKYDAAVGDFVRRILSDGERSRFLKDFRSFQRTVAYFGLFNSLAQTVLKLTSPGVPDIYQGTELLDLSLVDPDNRRPVDYHRRASLLSDIKKRVSEAGDNLGELAKQLLDVGQDGQVKLYVIYRVLSFRRANASLFASGQYVPLEATGEKAEHVCAYARLLKGAEVVVAVPRLVVGLTQGVEQAPVGAEVWLDTWLELPHDKKGARYRNVFTGETSTVDSRGGKLGLPLADVLHIFPVAMLERLGS